MILLISFNSLCKSHHVPAVIYSGGARGLVVRRYVFSRLISGISGHYSLPATSDRPGDGCDTVARISSVVDGGGG